MKLCPHCGGDLDVGLRFLDLELDEETRELSVSGRSRVSLPHRPAAMLAALMRARGKVVTPKAVLDAMAIWRDEPELVRVYKHQLKQLLALHGSAVRVACVRSRGYRLTVGVPSPKVPWRIVRPSHHMETGAAAHAQ